MDEEKFGQLVMECNNCHLQFYAPELSVDPQSNELMCKNCRSFPQGKVTIIKDRPLKKGKEVAQKPVFRPTQVRPMPSAIGKSAPAVPIARVKNAPQKAEPITNMGAVGYKTYRCQHCQYTFSRKTNFNGFCPYCGERLR